MKIGIFDGEMTHLRADFGITLCWCISDVNSTKLWTRSVLDYKCDWLGNADVDRKLNKDFADECERYDYILGWYSSGHDIPFLRGRMLLCGDPLPRIFDSRPFTCHRDLLMKVRGKFRFTSNRLEKWIDNLNLKNPKTKIRRKEWVLAGRGNEKCLKYVIDHCQKDVKATKEAYWLVEPIIKL